MAARRNSEAYVIYDSEKTSQPMPLQRLQNGHGGKAYAVLYLRRHLPAEMLTQIGLQPPADLTEARYDHRLVIESV